jgi:5-methylcytosine-specific restriction endonuclease McrA
MKPKRIKDKTDKDKFRSTQAWQRKRDEIKEIDLYLCQVCKANHKYIYNNLECHHIIPLEENFELRLDNKNLITVCEFCHEKCEKKEISREYLLNLIKDSH